MKNEAVFGSTLEELQSKDDQMVPKFVLKCIQCIENEDFLKIDGIYRVAGSLAEIQSIRGQSFISLIDGRYLYFIYLVKQSPKANITPSMKCSILKNTKPPFMSW